MSNAKAAVVERQKRKADVHSLAMSVYDYIDQGEREWAEWRKREIAECYGQSVLAEVTAEVERIAPSAYRSACRHSSRS